VKTFLQAVIQVTAAFHHLQRNNPVGAASLLRAAARRLDPYPARFEGIDVAALREDIGAWMQALAQEERPAALGFPRIAQSSLLSH
jgi:hypothetical protein